MLAHGFAHKPRPAESIVVGESSQACWPPTWMRGASPESDAAKAPVLVHVDGVGRSLFLDHLEARLATRSDPWTVIRFDAWQYQRVPPPWWWLIKAIDSELRDRRHGGRRTVWRRRARDYATRLLAPREGRWWMFLPVLFVAVGVAWLSQQLSSELKLLDVLEWAAKAVAAITTLLSIGYRRRSAPCAATCWSSHRSVRPRSCARATRWRSSSTATSS